MWFDVVYFFFFKQKTAYEMRISDWSSDVCSSDLVREHGVVEREEGEFRLRRGFEIPAGARVVMVEDIVTTGLSSRECLTAIRAHQIGRASCRERVCQYV